MKENHKKKGEHNFEISSKLILIPFLIFCLTIILIEISLNFRALICLKIGLKAHDKAGKSLFFVL